MNDKEHPLLPQLQFYSLAAFLFCSTFSIALSQVSFGISLVIFVVRIVIRRDIPGWQPASLYLWIGLYVLWMIIASLVGETPVASLLIMKEEWLFAIIPVGLAVMADTHNRTRMIGILAIGVLLMSIYAIVQSQTGWHLLKPGAARIDVESGVRISGNFSHPLTFANYFGLAAAFLFGALLGGWRSLSVSWRMLLSSSSALAVIAIFLTFTRSTVPALIVVLIVAAIVMGRRYFLPVAAAVVLVIVTVLFVSGLRDRFVGAIERETSTTYEAGRLFIWSRAITIVREHPGFGVGQGNFEPEYRALLRSDINANRYLTHAHNDVLNVAAICGIPGSVFFVGFFVVALSMMAKGLKGGAIQEKDRLFLVAGILGTAYFAVSSLTEAAFADEEVRQFLMFVWAAGLSTLNKPQTEGMEKTG